MGQQSDAATLQVGFAIDMGDSLQSIQTLDTVLGKAAADAVRQLGQVEAASSGVLQLGGASSQITAFGNATDRATQTAVQSLKRVESSGESMVRSLQRAVDTFGLTRTQIRAMDAETKALAAEGKGLDDLAGTIRGLSAVMQEQETSAEGVGEAHGHASNSTLLLQHSVRSAADSFAAGLPVSMIFAEQIGRVGEAAALAGGSFGKFGAFMAGPWGVAATAAIALASTLLPKLLESGDAADKEAEAFKTLTGATKALNEATGSANKSKQEEIGLSLAATQAKLKEAIAQRTLLAAHLAGEKDTLATPIGGTAGGGVQFAAAAGAQMTASALADNAKQIADAEKAMRGADFVTILNQVKAATDKTAAANQHYEATETSLRRAYEAGNLARGDLAKKLLAATVAQQAATEAGKGAHSQAIEAANDNARISAATTEVARAQAELTKARHDDAAAVRAGTMTQAAATADIAQHIQAVNAARTAHTAHAAAVRDGAKALRENELAEEALLSSLRLIQQQLDPTAAAARAYSDQVDQINKLASAGKITADQQRDYLLASALAFGEVGRKADDAATSLEGWGVKLDISKSTDQISKLIDHTALLGDTVNETGASFQDLGAHISGSMKNVGDLLQVLGKYGDQQAKIDKDRQAAGTDQKALDQISTRSLNNQISGTIGLLDAGKKLFSSHSAGYAAMEAAEKALTLVQLARTAVSVAAGAAQMFAELGPGGFAAVGAMVAVMASLGFSSGGGSSTAPVTNKGSGTVLGDNDAVSASLKNSLDQLRGIDDATLVVSKNMLTSLKGIESSIGGLSSLLVRTGNIDASAGVTEGYSGNTLSSIVKATVPIIGGFLGGVIDKLFGSKTTVTASGISSGPQSLGSILDGGFNASYFSDIEKQKKFLGITTSTKYSTQTTGADAQIEQQFGLVLKQFYTAIGQAAGPLGLATGAVEDKLSGFVVNLGKIDLKGLTGEQIQDKLDAVFGAAGDKMAEAAVPGLEKFQAVGEGYLQTLVRVASTVEQVDATFQQLGLSSKSMGADVDMAIAGQFDSVSDYVSAANAYFTTFYSSAEQAAAKTAQLGKVFDSLGLAVPATDADFRKLVEAQDLTTAAGQKAYTTLLQIAPAFADLQQSLQGAKSAADILSERADLQKQLDQLLGNTAAIRASELATLDPSNRALQQRIYDLTDEQAAVDAANKVSQERAGIQMTLLQLEGDTATIREQQIDALDESNRDLQRQVFALQDQQAAAQAAAAAAEAAAQAEQQLASQRESLEGQVLQLTGDTAEIRRRELAALDPSLVAIQERIYALTDEQAATQAATQAQQDALAKAQAFASEREGLEDQIYQLEENTAAQRYKALQALDPENRQLQQYIYNLQDQQAATAAAAQAAQDAAQAEQAIAQERNGLMQQLYTLTGNTAALRAMQLAALDPSNRALQEQIWAISDAQDAAKAAQDLADAWKSIGDSIVDEINRIRGLTDAGSPTGGFASLQGQFNAAIAAAQGGDQDAAKMLPDLSKALLDAAGAAATSRQELARVEAETAAALQRVSTMIGGGVAASTSATSTAATSSAANDNSAWWAAFAATSASSSNSSSGDIASLVSELRDLRDEVAGAREENNRGQDRIGTAVEKSSKVLDYASRRGGGTALATVPVAA